MQPGKLHKPFSAVKAADISWMYAGFRRDSGYSCDCVMNYSRLLHLKNIEEFGVCIAENSVIGNKECAYGIFRYALQRR
jgi:hypothetical protein